MKTSTLVPYCYGIAAENLALDSKLLEVYPEELIPMVSGDIVPEVFTLESNGILPDGKEYTASVNEAITIKCTWLPTGRVITPENVRRGERILIYRWGNSDKYFWRSAGLDQDLRRLETIVMVVSGNPDNADQTGFDLSNCYFLEISTHKKLITFINSVANGERAEFTFQLDTGEGTFLIEDEKGNSFFFDSVNTLYRILNADNTRIEMSKKLIEIFAEDSISMEAKTINITAGEDLNMSAVTTKLESSQSVDVTTTNYTLNASGSASITSPAIALNGPVAISSTLGVASAMTGSASIEVKSMEVSGESVMTGGLTVATVTSLGGMTASGKAVLTA